MKPLTVTEKMVWAVTYAIVRDRGIQNPPKRCLVGENHEIEWTKWEEWQVMQAIEHAVDAVEHLRKAGPQVFDGFLVVEDDGDVTDYGNVFAMWCDVTGQTAEDLKISPPGDDL